MNDPALAPPVPVPDADSAGYWAAAEDGTLALRRCVDCRVWQHPPQEQCRHCGGPARFEEVSGRGKVFSFIVIRQATVPGHNPPYVVGLVELDEQPGLRLTGVIDADPLAVAIDTPVQARMTDVGTSGFRAPEFELIDR